MFCKLDYFAFTFPIALQGDNDNEHTLQTILLALHDHTAHRLLDTVTARLWEWKAPAGFYTNRIQCPKSGVQIQWAKANRFALCTMSGTSLDVVLKSIDLPSLAACANGRATRLDFAVDFQTLEQPKTFVDAGYSDGFKSNGYYETETGSTYYVGSRNGERMARCYRYSSPHPRSHLLRVEVEYKGDAAKQACSQMLSVPLTELTLAAHAPFKWQHPLWSETGAQVSKIPARAYDREGAGTLRWLETSVVPALKKSHDKGILNLWEWFTEHFGDKPT